MSFEDCQLEIVILTKSHVGEPDDATSSKIKMYNI